MATLSREREIQRVLGAHLMVMRVNAGLSRATMAYMADVSPTTVQNFEIGASGASVWYLLKLAEALRVSVAELLEPAVQKFNSGV